MTTKKTLTAEKLLSALPRTKEIQLAGEHPLKGENIVIRALSATAYTEWLSTNDPVDSRVVLISNGLVEPQLTAADADKIAALDAGLVIELSNAIAAFSGLIPSLSEEPADTGESFRAE